MSFKSKNDIYQNMVVEDSDENDFNETIMDEESEVDQKISRIKMEASEHFNLPEINSSYEDKTDYENEDFERNSESVFVGVKQEWSTESEVPSKSMESFDSEDERSEFYIEKGSEGEEEDEEETIAMFVTASGQQLALYAVEDSDDYFAVAVYDESGEPPTNFQFLMKSDVERLIREGAVRTVKKPTQIKKQLVTTQPSMFMPKEEITEDVITRAESQIESINRRHADSKKTRMTPDYVKPVNESLPAPKIISLENSGSDEELVEQSTVQYILCDGDQSDGELTFDDIQATLKGTKFTDLTDDAPPISPIHPISPISKPPVRKPPPERKKTNNGLVYVTSPPIRNTSYRGAYYPPKAVKVENQSPPRQTPVKRSHISNTSIIGSKQNHGIKREASPMSDHFTPNTSANLSGNFSNTNSQFKVKRSRKQQLTSVNREDSEIIIQPASMLQDEEDEEPTPRKRGRRKKKIVAQEKSLKPIRKSKRRRTRVEIIDIDVDEDDSDEPSQGRKEILEITLDENKEKGSSDKENEVIMVGDSDEEEKESLKAASLKCKHCSKIFKQHRTLDSHAKVCAKLRNKSRRLSSRRTRADSDSEEETPKEKSSKREISRGKNSRESSKEKNPKQKKNSKIKKQYPCKTCDEKFDMVVSLARHVRAEHSARKRGRPSKSETQKNEKTRMKMRVKVSRIDNKNNQEKKIAETKPKEKNIPRREEKSEEKGLLQAEEMPKAAKVSESKGVVPHSKKKLIPSLKRKWRPTELTCINCSRWFSSAVALETHSLRHLTKKSAKRVYRCPVCKKHFQSQLLFLRHKRMHAKAKKNSESGKK